MDPLQDIAHRIIIPFNETAENLRHKSEEFMEAVLTQLFSYMIEFGVKYGYVSTGEAFLFLQVPDDPTVAYYHLSQPNIDVDRQAMTPDQLLFTSVGQITIMCIRAM